MDVVMMRRRQVVADGMSHHSITVSSSSRRLDAGICRTNEAGRQGLKLRVHGATQRQTLMNRKTCEAGWEVHGMSASRLRLAGMPLLTSSSSSSSAVSGCHGGSTLSGSLLRRLLHAGLVGGRRVITMPRMLTRVLWRRRLRRSRGSAVRAMDLHAQEHRQLLLAGPNRWCA